MLSLHPLKHQRKNTRVLYAEAIVTKAMKAIVQRVTKASVTVGEEQVSTIGRGLCVLLGISAEDTQKDVDYIVRKILNLRLFEDENGRAWSRSVMEKELEVLCVSQFTLQCILKGNKPDFHAAMPAEFAQPFYSNIVEQMRNKYRAELIKDGQFGAYMQVHIQNDGPVTIHLESPSGPKDPKQDFPITVGKPVLCGLQGQHMKLSKLEKQQQRKEKTRSKSNSEGRDRGASSSKVDHNASSGAEGDVSSEREP